MDDATDQLIRQLVELDISQPARSTTRRTALSQIVANSNIKPERAATEKVQSGQCRCKKVLIKEPAEATKEAAASAKKAAKEAADATKKAEKEAAARAKKAAKKAAEAAKKAEKEAAAKELKRVQQQESDEHATALSSAVTAALDLLGLAVASHPSVHKLNMITDCGSLGESQKKHLSAMWDEFSFEMNLEADVSDCAEEVSHCGFETLQDLLEKAACETHETHAPRLVVCEAARGLTTRGKKELCRLAASVFTGIYSSKWGSHIWPQFALLLSNEVCSEAGECPCWNPLQKMMNLALGDGVKCFKLVTHQTNEKAQRLFSKVGFEHCDEVESHNPSFTCTMRTKADPADLVDTIQDLLYSHIQKHGQYGN